MILFLNDKLPISFFKFQFHPIKASKKNESLSHYVIASFYFETYNL